MTAGFIFNRQYVQLEIPHNHFHAFFASSRFLIVNFKTRHYYSAVFPKDSILDVWLDYECASAVCVINYLFVNFPTRPLLLLSSLWWFKLFLFQLFRFSMKLTPAIQLATKSSWKDWWLLPISSHIIDGQKS